MEPVSFSVNKYHQCTWQLSTLLSELPLVLFDCEFEGVDWIYEQG